MAWVQNVTPPNNQKLEFKIQDFSGGLNNRSNMIEENQASNILNMTFLQHDVLEKRHGFKPFDMFTLPSPITHVSLYKPYTGEDVLIRATNTEVYANQTKIADVQGEINSINYQGQFFFCDGYSLFTYGLHNSTTSTYVDIVGTYPNDAVTLKVVNPSDGFVPLEDIHVRGKTVYNYTSGTVEYQPCLNELNDVYLGNNLLPEHPTLIETHKDRLFISGNKKDDDNVFITDIGTPFYFAVSLPIQLPPNSDKVRSLTIYDDSVIVGRQYDMYRITGETANPELGFPLFTLNKLNTHTGVSNHKAISTAHNYLLFLGSDGIAYALATTRMDARLLSTQIISNDIDVFKSPINTTQDEIRNASACFDTEFWYVTLGDKTLVYSYRHRAWTLFKGVDMLSPYYYYDRIIWGRSDGIVGEFSDDYLDNGVPILSTWESKVFDMGSATRYKQYREFYITAHAFDFNDSDIRVTFEIDYSDVKGAEVIENKIAYWGDAKFGGRFIDRNINESAPFMIGRRARNMRIRYSNGWKVEATVLTEQDLLDIPRKYNYMGAYVNVTSSYYYYLNGDWIKINPEQLNQPMRVYQISGEYELKGRR